VLHAASLAAGVEGVGPEGARDGLPYPLDEGLSEEGGALITPVDGGLVAAALGDGGDAGVLLERGGIREALAALAEGDEEAGGRGPRQRPAGRGRGRSLEAPGRACRWRHRGAGWRRRWLGAGEGAR
jgi:hypothetical protein